MKKALFVCLATISLFNRVSYAGQYELMDINGDRKVGLEEAVYALQVVAGIKTNATIEENTTITETIGYDNDNEDMIKIVTPANGIFQFTVENLNVSGSENGNIERCYLYHDYNAELIQVTYVADGGNSIIRPGNMGTSSKIAVSENGTYYIKIKQYENHAAQYEMKTSLTELKTVDSGESDNTYAEARLVRENETIISLIGYGYDEADWYKIQMSENGKFQFGIVNLHSEDVENGWIGKCYLYEKDDADLIQIAYVADGGNSIIRPGNSGASSYIAVAKNRTYYIKVPKYEHHAAPYQIKTSFTELKTSDFGESNDIYNDARLIQENETVISLIGYGNDETDWYKIQMPANGKFQFGIVNLHSENIGNGWIGKCYLYEKNGDELIHVAYVADGGNSIIRQGNSGASSDIAVSENGIYYIKVPKYEHHATPYQLETVFMPN